MWNVTYPRLRRDKRGASSIIVVVLSLVILVVVVSNIVLWSYEMNQLDWEKMKEDIDITDVEVVSRSSWFTAQSEYAINTGSRTSGTYTDTQTVDDKNERLMEDSTSSPYNPSGYNMGGSTSWMSGSVSDLASDNGVCMVFKSYASANTGQPLYAHQETTTIGSLNCYLLKLGSADAAGTTLSADAGTLGRKLMGRFVYPLTGVSSLPASTWTIYYRASQGNVNIESHCDVDILIRKSDGAIRSTIATNVANSATLTSTISWVSLSGTYPWDTYDVEDQTDYLEIDYYIEVTVAKAIYFVNFRIDDNTLSITSQTRTTNINLPSEFTSEVEFIGSSNTGTWTQLVVNVDSSLTTGSVTVTIQVYNYTLNGYPTAGNGYYSYVSSSTPNNNETRNQTITTNPENFRDGSGNWKIKVKGVKKATSPFGLEADWIEFKTNTTDYYSLDIAGTFTIDTSTYSLAHIRTIEIKMSYRAIVTDEKWYLKAYNWTSFTYSDSGFNSTAGHTPTTVWGYYTVNLGEEWRSYVLDNGAIYVKLTDEGADINQTTIEIDFLGVRAEIDGTNFTFENEGASTSHLVSLWIINSKNHQRYEISVFVNSADTKNYLRADISLPTGQYIVKVVTERGNIDVFSGSNL